MGNLKSFKEFINEDYVNEAKIDKFFGDTWYYKEIKIPGFTTKYNEIEADKGATKAASALVNFWEKGKSFEKSGIRISPESLTKLDNLSRGKVGDVIQIRMTTMKPLKDYVCDITLRDHEPMTHKKIDLRVSGRCFRV